jgi:hypothetical protein
VALLPRQLSGRVGGGGRVADETHNSFPKGCSPSTPGRPPYYEYCAAFFHGDSDSPNQLVTQTS